MTKEPVKRNPLLQGHPGLEFDNLTPEEVIATTDDQKTETFLSRYLESFHGDRDGGTDRFSRYFGSSAKGEAWELRDIKLHYKNLVLSGKWEEDKFVAVLNSLYEDHLLITPLTLEARGKFYDQGKLRGGPRGYARRRGRI